MKEIKAHINVYIDKDVRDKIQSMADEQQRSFSQMVSLLLDKAIKL